MSIGRLRSVSVGSLEALLSSLPAPTGVGQA